MDTPCRRPGSAGEGSGRRPVSLAGSRGARAALRVGLAAGLLTMALSAARGADLPQRFEAHFVLRAEGLDIGATRWHLTPIGDGRFLYRSQSEALGIARLLRDERIEERSEWRIADDRVQPLRYTYNRAGGNRTRVVEVRFDWDRGRVLNTINGDTWSMPVGAGTLDKLVYLLALMKDLAQGVRETRYAVADGGKVKTYRLRVVRSESIDTTLGTLDTVVVERTRDDDDRLTLVWCAPALSYLPVRVEHRESAGVLHLELTHLDGLAAR